MALLLVTELGSEPVNLIEIAFVMTRNTRQSLHNGVYTPVESFNDIVRRQNKRLSD